MSRYEVGAMRAFRLGLTVGQLREFLDVHHWQCDICSREWDDEKQGGGLVIDHDHSCCGSQAPKVASEDRPRRLCGGCIRGVLCHGCNNALGHFGDDPDRLRRAAGYLEAPRPEMPPRRKQHTPRGAGHGSAKLTEEEVREMRSRYAGGGWTYVDLATQYGVSATQASDVIRRRAWASTT